MDKPRYIPVTDPAAIEAIKSGRLIGNLRDPIGDCINGVWWAEKHSFEAWSAWQSKTDSEAKHGNGR